MWFAFDASRQITERVQNQNWQTGKTGANLRRSHWHFNYDARVHIPTGLIMLTRFLHSLSHWKHILVIVLHWWIDYMPLIIQELRIPFENPTLFLQLFRHKGRQSCIHGLSIKQYLSSSFSFSHSRFPGNRKVRGAILQFQLSPLFCNPSAKAAHSWEISVMLSAPWLPFFIYAN